MLALLNAVKAEPDDDTAKLALADWLQEQPDPADVARGEWLWALTERDRLPDDDPRRADLYARSLELWRKHHERWAGPLKKAGMRFPESETTFARGLLRPEIVGMKLASREGGAVTHSELFAWVGGLVFRELLPGQLARVLGTPLVESLTDLHVIHPAAISYDDSAALANSPYLTNLRSLNVDAISTWRIGHFAELPNLRSLRHLRLVNAELGDAGFAALCRSSSLNSLRSLNVVGNGLSIHSARAFADSWALPALIELIVGGGNRIGPDGTLILVASARTGRLTQLNLKSNGIADYGVEAICRQPHMNRLTALDLSDNLLTDRAAIALAAAERMKTLEVLALRQNGIASEGALALAGSSNLANIRVLDLRGNLIGEKGVEALRERFGARARLD